MREVFCLTYKATQYVTPMILCSFDIDYQPILKDEAIQAQIVDVISKEFNFILTEHKISKAKLFSELVKNKWQVLRFKNTEFNCNGELKLEKIKLY